MGDEGESAGRRSEDPQSIRTRAELATQATISAGQPRLRPSRPGCLARLRGYPNELLLRGERSVQFSIGLQRCSHGTRPGTPCPSGLDPSSWLMVHAGQESPRWRDHTRVS